jgi:hypothetical protein
MVSSKEKSTTPTGGSA